VSTTGAVRIPTWPRHIQYGKDNFDGYWGFSPATIPSTNGYTEFGAPPLSVGGYRPDGNRESTRAGPVVSIYSVLLLIEEQPEATMANMERLLKNFPTLNHPVYGMMDSVAVQDGTVAKCILHANTTGARRRDQLPYRWQAARLCG
jgi:hypothetical protein